MNQSNDKKKRNRFGHSRFNPLGLQDEDLVPKDKNDDKDYEDIPAEQPDISQNLQSFDPAVRELATFSLASILSFSQDELTELIDNGVIKLLLQRLVDPNPQIVLNTLQALINITESNLSVKGKNIGEILIDIGILIMLESILTSFKSAHEKREIDTSTTDFRAKLAIVDNCFRFLSTLAEIVGDKHLAKLLASEVTSVSLYFTMNCDEPHILTGITCYLHVLTEVSSELCQQMMQNMDFIKRLATITKQNYCTQELKAYIYGALYNYVCTLEKGGFEVPGKIEISQEVMNGIITIIGIDIFDEVNGLIKIFEAGRKNKANDHEDADPINHEEEEEVKEETKTQEYVHAPKPSEPEMKYREAVKIWNDTAIAIEICVGLLVNLFESDDTQEDWQEDGEDEESNPNPGAEYIPAKTIFVEGMTPDVKEKLLILLASKCKHLSPEVKEALNECSMSSVFEQIKSLINFSFSAIMNILLSIGYDKSSPDQLNKISEDIFKLAWDEVKHYIENIFEYAQAPDLALESADKAEFDFCITIIEGILKIVVYIMQASAFDIRTAIKVEDLVKACRAILQYVPQESKIMLIGLVGSRCHPKYQITTEENACVGDFLLELLKSEDIMVLGETLNAIFDVYSDETYDQIFVEKGYMNVLNYGYDVFKNKISEKRGELSKEDYGLLKNHLLNLKRFIKYKQDHIPH